MVVRLLFGYLIRLLPLRGFCVHFGCLALAIIRCSHAARQPWWVLRGFYGWVLQAKNRPTPAVFLPVVKTPEWHQNGGNCHFPPMSGSGRTRFGREEERFQAEAPTTPRPILLRPSRHHTAISGVCDGWVETDPCDGCGMVLAFGKG